MLIDGVMVSLHKRLALVKYLCTCILNTWTDEIRIKQYWLFTNCSVFDSWETISRFIDSSYFKQMFGQIYPTESQLNKANSSDIEAPFWGLNLSITNDKVCSKIYDMEASLRAKQKFVL